MLLHQILRLIPNNIPIMLLDIEKVIIGTYENKADIDINLYEEQVFLMAPGPFKGNKMALYIMLSK